MKILKHTQKQSIMKPTIPHNPTSVTINISHLLFYQSLPLPFWEDRGLDCFKTNSRHSILVYISNINNNSKMPYIITMVLSHLKKINKNT